MDRTDLHPYQLETVEEIKRRPDLIGVLPMGAGKTISTLTAFVDLQDAGQVDRLWIFAPKRIAQTVWAQEAAAWSHTRDLAVSVVLGPAEARLAALRRDADVYVCTYDLADWLVSKKGGGLVGRLPEAMDMVVYDEITRLKNHKSTRGRIARELGSVAARRLGLTGTPAPRDLLDLWAQAHAIDGGRMWGASWWKWRQARFVPLDYQGYRWAPLPGHEHLLMREFARLCFRVEPPARPAPVVLRHTVQLPAAAKRAHDEALSEYVLSVGGLEALDAEALESAAVGMGKARQIAGGTVLDGAGAAHVVHEAKAEAVRDIVEDAGESVLVLYQYRAELEMIRRLWPDARVLGGETGDKEALSIVEDWNRGRVPVLAGHPASMGHGLNLQAGGRRVVWWSLPWSLELWQQANARLDRQGQTAAQVYIHVVVAEGTVDEVVMARLEGREGVQDALLRVVRTLSAV